MITIPMPEWYEAASCASVGADFWYPEKGGDSGNHAKKVCAVCPVRSQCLEWALDNGERFGVWGGKSERERHKLGSKRRCGHCGKSFALGNNPSDRMCSEECRRASRSKTVEGKENALRCIQCGAASNALRCSGCIQRHHADQISPRAKTKDAA